jgi:hypothetical protein
MQPIGMAGIEWDESAAPKALATKGLQEGR